MPVIPTFSSFASTPDTAGAFLGGARIAQAAAQHAQTIQLEQQKLSQRAQMAEMEMQAKEKQYQRDAMRRDQELQVENAYKQAQIGMRQRDLDQQQKVADMKIAEAAREFQMQQQYQKRFRELGGNEDAARKAMWEIGPAGGSSFTAAIRGDAAAAPVAGLGEITDIPGAEGLRRFKSGPHSFQIVPNVPSSLNGGDEMIPIEGSGGAFGKIGNKVVRIPDNPEIKIAATELRGLQAANLKYQQDYDRAKANPNSPEKQSLIKRYEENEKRIEELRKKMGQSTFSAAATAPSGSSTNKVGRFTIIAEE